MTSNNAPDPLRVGVVGCGVISKIYLENLQRFSRTAVVAVADSDETRAKARAAEFGVPHALTTRDLIAHDDVDLVLNLTPPVAHHPVSLAAVDAGKHVYNEKPLTIDFDNAGELLAVARKRGVRVGCAPDTVLGVGVQSARAAIDRGDIGSPVGFLCAFQNRGPESWHPDPDFFYRRGAGPLFDMGPYYLSMLVTLLGPIRSLCAVARPTFDTRTIRSDPRRGQTIDVETPTHIHTLLHFRNGAAGTLLTSFDVAATNLPRGELYGSTGTLNLPDPNSFKGPVGVHDGQDWRDLEEVPGFSDNSRGIGVAQMADAIQHGTPHLASGELALHVLEAMHAALRSWELGRWIELESQLDRPAPMPADFRP